MKKSRQEKWIKDPIPAESSGFEHTTSSKHEKKTGSIRTRQSRRNRPESAGIGRNPPEAAGEFASMNRSVKNFRRNRVELAPSNRFEKMEFRREDFVTDFLGNC